MANFDSDLQSIASDTLKYRTLRAFYDSRTRVFAAFRRMIMFFLAFIQIPFAILNDFNFSWAKDVITTILALPVSGASASSC